MSSHELSIPGPCPCCGAISLAPVTQRSTLLAVADVLVYKALEKLGSSIVRKERGRYNQIGSKPKYTAHTIWTPMERDVQKALQSAWDVVPALLDVHGCAGVTSVQITTMLDEYVRDLAITGTEHHIDELMHRFENRLGIPVFDTIVQEDDQIDPEEEADYRPAPIKRIHESSEAAERAHLVMGAPRVLG